MQEAATKGVHEYVKVKFKYDPIVYSLPWKDIDVDHLFPVTAKPNPVSTSASSSIPVVELESENGEGDCTSSKEARPFAPTAKSRGNDKDQDRQRAVAVQRMQWLSGGPHKVTRREPHPLTVQSAVGHDPVSPDSSVMPPDMRSTFPDMVKDDIQMPNAVQSSRSMKPTSLLNIGDREAGSSARPPQVYQPRNHVGCHSLPPLTASHINSIHTFRRAQPLQDSALPRPSRVQADPLPPLTTRPTGSLHPWRGPPHEPYSRHAPSHVPYRAQTTVPTNWRITPSGPERSESVESSPSQKRKEGLLEFTTSGQPPPDANNSPLGARHPERHALPTSESDPYNFTFPSPSKRARKNPAPALIPRHPVRGLNDIRIPRYREHENTGFRIPRVRDKRDQSEHVRPLLYGASTNERAGMAQPAAARRLDVLFDIVSNDPFESSGQNESLSDGNNKAKTSSPVRSEMFRHKVIPKTRRQPVGPVARSFKGTAKFPFKSDVRESSDRDAEVLGLCDKVIVMEVEEEEKPVDEIARDLETISVSQPRSSGTCRRRKSTPRRWRSRALPRVRIGVLQTSADRNNTTNTISEEAVPEEVSDFRICDCICGFPLGERNALQCGMCGLWSHASCIQTHGVLHTRNGVQTGRKRFMCAKCTERIVTEKSILAGVKDDDAAHSDSRQEPVSFFFAQIPVASNNTIARYSTPDHSSVLLYSGRHGVRDKATPKVRPPLTAGDVNARAANVELLRSGVRRPSAGKREQDVIDAHFKGRGLP